MLPQRADDVRDDVPVDVLTPDHVEVLVLGQRVRPRVALGQLVEHRADVDKRVAVPVEKDNRADDVARGEAGGGIRGDAGGARDAADEHDALDVVVVHLELGVAHDLEPVHDGLDGRGGVEVRVRGEALKRGDVVRVPVEEPAERGRDHSGEDGRIEEGLPGWDGGHDGFAAEDEENERRPGYGAILARGKDEMRRKHVRGFHETIHDRGSKPSGLHSGCECDKYVDLLIQRRVDGERSEGLSGTLAEADVAQAGLLGDL